MDSDRKVEIPAVMHEPQTVVITNVESDPNLVDDRSNLDLVTWHRRNETDKFQCYSGNIQCFQSNSISCRTSCKSQTVVITNVECDKSLGVGPTNLDVVTLHRPDGTSKFQQWIQIQKGDNAVCFKNVGSGTYLCEDTNPTSLGGVRVDLINQFKWKLQQVNNHWTIRPFSASEKLKNLRMESELKPVKLHARRGSANTCLWSITTVFLSNEI